jgi:hypothetical protein
MFKPILSNNGKATILQTIEEYFKSRNFRFETTENKNNLIVPVSGENGNSRVLLCVDEKRGISKSIHFVR